MAGGAVGAELSKMFVRFGMTGNALFRCALIYAIFMTGFTFYVCVCAIQFEGREIVIERGGRPAIGRVTSLTLCAIGKLMHVIRVVAGVAIL